MGIGELASTREARGRDDGNERRARAGSQRRALNPWFANFFYQSVILQQTFELVQSVDND